MGINVMGRNSDARYPCKPSSVGEKVQERTEFIPAGNPDPKNYKFLDTFQIGKYLIVEMLYPDCKNYEGKKILVYKDVTFKELQKQKLIDPHFSDNRKFRSPIARFEPSQRGF